MQGIRLPGLALVGALGLGCSDSDPIEPDPERATVVIANTAFGASNVNVGLAGIAQPIAIDLDFAEYTAVCAVIPAGAAITLTFTSGPTVLATEDVTLTDGGRYTILLVTNGENEHVVVLEDEVEVANEERAVRFVNATPAPGDVYLFATGDAMGEPAESDLAYAGTAAAPPSYLLRASDQTVARFFDPDVSEETPRAEVTLPSAAEAPITTVIFAETATTTEVFVLEPCG